MFRPKMREINQNSMTFFCELALHRGTSCSAASLLSLLLCIFLLFCCCAFPVVYLHCLLYKHVYMLYLLSYKPIPVLIL